MTDVTLFKDNPLVDSDLFKQLLEINEKISGGGRGYRRISIRGGRFRQIVDGTQTAVNSTGAMNVVILDAAPVARFFFAGTYDPDKSAPPTCWSTDTRAPSQDVPEDQRQADRCMDCPNNIKGSGQGESRACRFSQRFAVAIEGELNTVYQLQLPATSIFGDPNGGKMPMQAYAKHLSAHSTPAIGIVTQMYFDEDSETPKLFFKPVRPLTREEVTQVVEARGSEDTKRALELTVSQTDAVQEKPKAEAPAQKATKAAAKATAKVTTSTPTVQVVEDDDADDEPVAEPTKVERKPKVEETPAKKPSDLQSIVDEWDD
jgi:hypothetical protein